MSKSKLQYFGYNLSLNKQAQAFYKLGYLFVKGLIHIYYILATDDMCYAGDKKYNKFGICSGQRRAYKFTTIAAARIVQEKLFLEGWIEFHIIRKEEKESHEKT